MVKASGWKPDKTKNPILLTGESAKKLIMKIIVLFFWVVENGLQPLAVSKVQGINIRQIECKQTFTNFLTIGDFVLYAKWIPK